jgi:hypothetical protein
MSDIHLSDATGIDPDGHSPLGKPIPAAVP